MFTYNFTIFFEWFGLSLQGTRLSPYNVESVFFKLLTLAPMMPKLVLGIGDFDYWKA